MKNKKKEEKERNYKYKVLFSIICCLSIILIIKLFYLQIVQYKTYTQRAQYSTSRISVLTAPRGIIYDRNNKIIATNKQSISVIAYPNKLKTKEERLKIYNILSKILKSNQIKLKEAILKLPNNAPLPIRLQSNINIQEATLIIEKQHLLSGISIQKEPTRFYPFGSLAAHVLGYISQINEKELEKRPDRKMGDLVGKDGIEKLYDDVLRGKDGKTIVAVDRYGKPINTSYKHSVIHINPVPGRDIKLTIDLDLQLKAEDALKNTMASGAIIISKVDTGEILALASYPVFDPNIFTKPISNSTWNDLLIKRVFLNRALLAYPPGSIWKPITLLAALDSMAVKPNERFKVSEAVYIGNTRFGDWTNKEGFYSLEESLAWSRDTAFYQIAQKITPSLMKEWGEKLGAGRKTGIELLGEEEGIVPNEKWKKENLGEPWYPGNTLHFSIGQGFLLLTPLQVARIYSAIANGNKVPKLQLVKQVNKYIKPYQIIETFKVYPDAIKVVRDGLERCVNSGTGQVSKLEHIKVAGKTGSAEVIGSKKTHSWFAAYAPAKNPEIVVVVINEKAGHGGDIAAKVSKQIFEYYLSKI